MQCSPSDGTCSVQTDNYSSLSVRQLKQLLSQHNIDHSQCLEKSQLVQLAREGQIPITTTTTLQNTIVSIEIVSDTMCPWCFVGKRKMEQAISQFQQTNSTVRFDITWLPFFLNPNIPEEGYTIAEYLGRVYGDSKKLEGVQQYLAAAGKQVGINFKLDVNRKVYPTLHSHRLIEWAKGFNKQDEAMETVFKLHFEEGKALNDINMLSEVAKTIGLDPEAARKYLMSKENISEIEHQDMQFKQGHRGVNGVPHFIIYKNGDKDHSKSLSGAQQPEAFVSIFQSL